MKKMNHLIFFDIMGFVLLMCMVNFYLSHSSFMSNGREYRISINRIKQAVLEYEAEKGTAPDNLGNLQHFSNAGYPLITGISAISMENSTKKELARFLTEEDADYVVLATEDYYYKVTYEDGGASSTSVRWIVNGVCICLFFVLLFFLFYVRGKILLPFYKLSEIPYELSKGNLTVPLKENKNRFFGRFVWGMDLLRENLEENKAKELELQKEKKLLLSLSHDIKTPLSAIKLYAKALSKNLYKDEEKKQEISENINVKVDEIESYISEIVRASNEDFLHFDVANSEIYIQNVMEQIREYYSDKMQLNQIVFEIGDYPNCLVFGDGDRLVEVIQNVIENAIKYGDGKRIWLEFEKNEEEFAICIYNTGCTLEKKELLHIFDSFFRGSNVEKKTGSGLGLYICRELMHLMEGEITAQIIMQEKECIMEVKVSVHMV